MGPIAYSYNPKTFLYSGPVKAQPCKIQVGVFYAPKFSTFEKPPEPVPGRAVAFDDLKKSWVYVAAPKPVEVLKPKDVEKVVEVRENSDLLNQMIANERMILGIELQKKIDSENRKVVDLILSLDSRVKSFETALNDLRSVVSDYSRRGDSSYEIVKGFQGHLSGQDDVIENLSKVIEERVSDLKVELESLKGDSVVEPSGDLVSSVAPKKSWKFWS